MKNIRFALPLLFISRAAFTQGPLTLRDNAPAAGDSAAYREIRFADPGSNGPDQIWDFSKIVYTANSTENVVEPAAGVKSAGTGTTVILHEAGYAYSMNVTGNSLVELGYTNAEKKLTLEYTDPVIKMKFPFSYGDRYTDPFAGIAYYDTDNRLEFSGNLVVEADAFGTLILPDRVIKNTLRVRSAKSGLQVNTCGTVEISIVKYCWYAPGYRYPVLSIAITENRYSGGKPEITRAAYVATRQNSGGNNATATGTGTLAEKSDVSVIVYPNPFTEKLTYNYFLRKQLPVSIELYDMSGRYSMRLVNNQQEGEGLHTGELNGLTHGLTPGVYYLRFTFDKQVVVEKVVRM